MKETYGEMEIDEARLAEDTLTTSVPPVTIVVYLFVGATEGQWRII